MSEKNLIERWKNLKQSNITELQCKLCNEIYNINQFKIYKTNDIFHAGELIRYQCPNCDVIFGDLRFLNLDQKEIDQDYIDLYSYYKEGDTTDYILNSLKECNLDKNWEGLDFACGGWNRHLKILNDLGYNVSGYDKYIKNRDYMLDDIKGKIFDYIFSNNYIEHLIHPIQDLEGILSHLKPGGLLILITECFDYRIEYTHYHTFFFIGRSISYLEKKLNIKLILDKRINVNYNQFTFIKVFQKKE